MTQLKHVVLYARLSVTKEESVSIERQLYSERQYAEARGWNIDDTLLQGTFFRLAFGRRKELRKRFRRRKR